MSWWWMCYTSQIINHCIILWYRPCDGCALEPHHMCPAQVHGSDVHNTNASKTKYAQKTSSVDGELWCQLIKLCFIWLHRNLVTDVDWNQMQRSQVRINASTSGWHLLHMVAADWEICSYNINSCSHCMHGIIEQDELQSACKCNNALTPCLCCFREQIPLWPWQRVSRDWGIIEVFMVAPSQALNGTMKLVRLMQLSMSRSYMQFRSLTYTRCIHCQQQAADHRHRWYWLWCCWAKGTLQRHPDQGSCWSGSLTLTQCICNVCFANFDKLLNLFGCMLRWGMHALIQWCAVTQHSPLTLVVCLPGHY